MLRSVLLIVEDMGVNVSWIVSFFYVLNGIMIVVLRTVTLAIIANHEFVR